MKDLVKELKCDICSGKDECEVYAVIKEYYCSHEACKDCGNCKNTYTSVNVQPCLGCVNQSHWEDDRK